MSIIYSIDAIVDAGKSHGSTREDIYGCLYFYLSEQLRSFADRLDRFRVNFCISSSDARELSKRIRQGDFQQYGIPSDMRFDRIDVSNILDTNYVGISRVLDDWEPFLERSTSAKIIGYFMNWPLRQEGGDPKTLGRNRNEASRLMQRTMKMNGVWEIV
jgi:hypothetical protein